MGQIIRRIIAESMAQYYWGIMCNIEDDVNINDDYTYAEHIVRFPQDVTIYILYNLYMTRMIAGEKRKTCISFKELKDLLSYDLEQSAEVYNYLRNLIVCKKPHDTDSLIIMYHIPYGKWFLLDGHHRFIEYEKFSPDEENVPVLVVESDELMPAIDNRGGFIAYCILRNLYVVEKLPVNMWGRQLLKIFPFLK